MRELSSGSAGYYTLDGTGAPFLLDGVHNTGAYAVQLYETPSSGKMIFSGGFDATLCATSVRKQKTTTKVNLKAVLQSVDDILQLPHAMPFVYCLHISGNVLHVALETGNVLGFRLPSLGKLEFCIEGHTTRVIHCTDYGDKLLTVSDDLSWALWDRQTTKLAKKVAIKHKPNYVASLGDKVLVADISEYVSIFEFK